jgi:hypothetical protein
MQEKIEKRENQPKHNHSSPRGGAAQS